MPTITWAKKKSKQIYLHRTKGTYCSYMGNYKKVNFQHSFRRQQFACSAQSAQIGRYFSLSTTGPSKGVPIFNFFIVPHVATIYTFGSIYVDLLGLFLAQVIVSMSCDQTIFTIGSFCLKRKFFLPDRTILGESAIHIVK